MIPADRIRSALPSVLLGIVFCAAIQATLATTRYSTSRYPFRHQTSWNPLIARSRYSFRSQVCERRTTTISCTSSNHVLFIEDAYFGRADNTTCRSFNTRIFTTRCHSRSTFPRVWRRCNGRRSCSLTASTSVYGDPCRGTYKYLEIQYRCAAPGSNTIGVCLSNSWGSWLNVDSPSGNGDYEMLALHRRRSRGACQNPTGLQIQYARTNTRQWPYNSDPLRHSLNYGAACTNSFTGGTCKDYRVRYCCVATPTTTASPRVTCPRPTGLTSSIRKQSWNVRETIIFSCPDGYTLNGASRAVCQADGTWSHGPPECTPPGCPRLTDPANGYISQRRFRWTRGSIANFQCESNYVISGQSSIRCMSNNQWSHPAPTCVPENATTGGCGGRITGRQSGQIRTPNYPSRYPPNLHCVWSIVVNPGQTIQVTFVRFDVEFYRRCVYDYIEIYNGTSRNTRIQKMCGTRSNRVFTTNVPSVTIVFHSDSNQQNTGFLANWRAIGGSSTTCAVPAAPTNGYIVSPRSSYSEGDWILFRCNNGFTVSGSSRAQCRSGQWSVALPTCTRSTPSLPAVSTCYAVGDPHYRTFDGRRYDFQGTCSYVLVRSTTSRYGDLPSFVIEVDNEHRGRNNRVSWLRKVIIRIGNTPIIEMMRGRMITVGGTLVNLPYISSQNGINIRFSGRFVMLSTSYGLEVVYDGNSYLTVALPRRFSEHVEGLCGNYNGNRADEFRRRGTTTLLSSPVEFANQYQTPTKPGCAPEQPSRDEVCPAGNRARFTRMCSILTREGGCFAGCHSSVDAAPFLENCVFDACAYNDAQAAIDNNVGAYARACQDRGATICETWRNETNTPLSCPPNSHYSACTSRCPATCGLRHTACDRSCVEGCQCDDGYMLSGDTCVRQADCGCLHEGRYYRSGDSFYTPSCSRRCSCERGRMTCRSSRCGSAERCSRDQNGRLACLPTGLAVCKAWGDPHYMTFDGSGWFDFMGTCVYQMARTHTIATSDPRWFSVEAGNEHRGRNTRVSYLRFITVRLSGGDTVIRLDKNRVARVNGQVVQGYESSLFEIAISGRSIVLTTSHGLRVSFNGNGVRIRIPSTYLRTVNGLCGNYNGIRSDDLETSSGSITTDFNEFAQSYQIGRCNEELPEPVTCTDRDRRRWGAPAYCGALVNSTGVFQPCHSEVNTQMFFEKCVFDVCATEGDRDVLVQALESYVGECQARDVGLCSWRRETGVQTITCPSNSHYEGCATACPDTCYSPYASANCRISAQVEACVCNVGYIRDGDRCIRRSDCGCVVGEMYISKGRSFARASTYEVCTCRGMNRYDCTCIAGYTGQPCRDINECLSNPCDSNAACVNTRGSFNCQCNDGYSGDGLQCTAEASCPVPSTISNGYFSPPIRTPRPVDSVVSYRCNAGWQTRRGDNTFLRCEDGGTWSDSAPTCVDIDECEDGSDNCDSNAECSNTVGGYNCVCDEGYTGNGRSCSAITCPPFTRRANQIITPYRVTRYPAFFTVRFSCSGGYSLVGQNNLTCTSHGRWSADQPRCIEVDECRDGVNGQPACDRNAICTNTASGYNCACRPGFTGNGRTCVAIQCRLPTLPPNVRVDSEPNTLFDVGAMITYSCADGYRSQRPTVSRCQSSGTWSALPPQCSDINECRESTHSCDRNATCTNTRGSYTCSCNRGFTGNGRTCQRVTCPVLRAPANGILAPADVLQFFPPFSLRFGCNNGFELVGDAVITCLYDGRWSGSVPTCADVDECRNSNPCSSDARCRNSDGTFECNCNPGYQGDGIVCDEIMCGMPPDVFNGEISAPSRPSYPIGTTALYVCDDGYEFESETNSVSCQMNGEWSRPIPRCVDVDECEIGVCDSNANCQNEVGSFSCTCRNGYSGDGFTCNEITCPPLEAPRNGDLVLSSLAVGSVATYTCNDGYEAVHSRGSECLPGGRWTISELECRDIDECSNPPSVDSCDIYATCINTEGSFECFCNAGFTGDGVFCEMITCEMLEAPEFGSINPPVQVRWVVNDTVTFTCQPGHSLMGDDILTCQDDTLWSGSPPVCVDINECEDLPLSPCNPNAECENTIGGYTCTCLPGYSGSGTMCDEINCIELPLISNGFARPVNLPTSVGSIIRYRCNTGYQFANEQTINTLRCESSGTWDTDFLQCMDIDECASEDTNPCDPEAECTNLVGSLTCECNEGYTGDGLFCNRIQCGQPPFVRNAIRSGGNLAFYPLGTEITYTCRGGYFIDGSDVAICDETQTWSRDDFECEDIDECEIPNTCPDNSRCENTIGGYRCRCESGFSGDGTTSCERITCSVLPAIENGSFDEEFASGVELRPYSFGDSLLYMCNPGYQVQGTSLLRCMINGDWSDSPPTCIDINECSQGSDDCSQNGFCSNTEGSFTCDCQGGYSGDGRSCSRITCARPVGLDRNLSPILSLQTYPLNSRLTYSCLAGYRIEGLEVGASISVRCTETGLWSEEPPTCVDVDECATGRVCPREATCLNSIGSYACECNRGYVQSGNFCRRIICPSRTAPVNGRATSPASLPYGLGDRVEYSCDDGFLLDGSSFADCREDGSWTADVPTCNDINECESEVCHPDATCVNNPGSYMCSCNPGFSGDGINCNQNVCPQPVPPIGGSISNPDRTVWSYPQSVEYSCNTGYDIQGQRVALCLPTGLWSSPAPTCENINECTDRVRYPCDVNARCTDNDGSYTCTCNEGFTGSGRICQRVMCRAPSELVPNRRYQLSNRLITVGTTIFFECATGYMVEGDVTATCLPSGEWSAVFPTCVDFNECQPDNPCGENTVCANTIGSFECSCITNYVDNGDGCVEIVCIVPRIRSNVIITPNLGNDEVRSVGQSIEYSCIDGYQQPSLNIAICLVSGQWSVNPPICEDINECEQNNSPCSLNAFCENSVGSFICTCFDGYSGDGIVCEDITCQELPSITPLGSIERSGPVWRVNDQAVYSCTDGYDVIGRNFITCLSTGQWSADPLECVDIDECTTSSPCHVHATCTNVAGSFECRCNEDFTGDGITCTRRTCPALEDIENGYFPNTRNDYFIRTEIIFSCHPGYRISGEQRIICTRNGWSHAQPTCDDINECENNPCSLNAYCTNMDGGFNCTCNDGYVMFGRSCVEIRCGRPESLRHGSYPGELEPSNTWAIGEELSYSCNQYYQISGQNPITCTQSGQWSHPAPSCVDIDECQSSPCGANARCDNIMRGYVCTCDAGYIMNNGICEEIRCSRPFVHDQTTRIEETEDSFAIGTVIQYTCLPGFRIFAQTTSINCTEEGVWSAIPPVCTDVDECRNNPCDSNAVCLNQRGTFQCECNRGYTGDGSICTLIECPLISAPLNGMIISRERTQYVVGNRIFFSCNSGYELRGGRNLIICRDTSSWSGSVPECVDTDECASELTNPCSQQATCQNSIGSYTCTCNDGYSGNGVSCSRIICLTGGPRANSDGPSRGTSVQPGNSVTYVCHAGFETSDETVITCQPSGLFTSAPPVCTDIDECSIPNSCDENAQCSNQPGSYACSCNAGYTGDGSSCQQILCQEDEIVSYDNSVIMSSAPYLVGDSVFFGCANGYRNDGTQSSVCLQSGQWSQAAPRCEDVNECTESQIYPCHSSASCQNEIGGFSCVCNTGFTGDGQNCRRIECPLPSAPLNGFISNPSRTRWLLGQIFSYFCEPGYVINGFSSTECLVSGAASVPAPTCDDVDECETGSDERCDRNSVCTNTIGSYDCTCRHGYTGDGSFCTRVMCPTPVRLLNRIYRLSSSSITVGTNATFSCTDGYRLSGESTATCRDTGGWSISLPNCVDINECTEGIPCGPNSLCTNSIGSFSCSCVRGYVDLGRGCEAIACRAVSAPLNGEIVERVSGSFRVNTTLRFRCDDGFLLDGDEVIVCLENGFWTNDPPQCSDVDECADIRGPCDANARCRNTFGSFTCTCRDGYSGDGRLCTDITCQELPSIAPLGSIERSGPVWRVNDQAVYSCTDGYHVIGRNFITCLSTGQWSAEPLECVDIDECTTSSPCHVHATCTNVAGSFECRCNEDFTGDGITCTRRTCPALDDISNGFFLNTRQPYVIHSEINFSCQSGYRISGEESIVCTRDGWSHDQPTCEDINECESLPCDINADCENLPGSHACTCIQGYIGSGRTCEEIRCGRPESPRHGSYPGELEPSNTWAIGEELSYSCNQYYQISGQNPITCTQSGQWSHPAPSCVDIDECQSNPCGANARCDNIMRGYVCTCDAGYIMNNGICEEIRCSRPPVHDQTTRIEETEDSFAIGTVIQYTCLPGFRIFAQTTSINCTEEGVWSAIPPVCTDVDECRNNPCDSNAVCLNQRGTFQCECNRGYTGDGSTCTLIECPLISAPLNGMIISRERTQYVVGNQIFFSCNSGYELRGERNFIICRDTSSWSGSVPECVDMDECASELTNPCSQQATCQNNIGSYTCTCNEGYSGNGISCSRIICLTDRPRANSDGPSRGTSVQPGNSVTYACHAGFETSDETVITCQSSGLFTSAPPVCTDINECDDPNTCDENARCTNMIGGHSCSCDLGYTGDGSTCQLIVCDAVVAPDNGIISLSPSSINLGATVVYACNTGYINEGPLSATCLEIGWSSPVPTCRDINECSNSRFFPCSPDAVCLNTAGSFTCTCRPGYTGNGRLCQRITCSTPPIPANGGIVGNIISTHYDVDDVVNYQCNPGYTISGSSSITCLDTMLWSADDTTCVDINECESPLGNPCGENSRCENTEGLYRCMCNRGYRRTGSGCELIRCNGLSDPANGRLEVTSNTYEGIATFTCNPGYTIVGRSELRCMETGLWDHESPFCRDINECITNNPCDSNAFCRNTGGGHECSCFDGYSGDGTTCFLIECEDPPTVSNGRIIFASTVFTRGSRVRYACNDGYRMVSEPPSSDEITCTADAVWSVAPTCTDIDECSDELLNSCHGAADCSNTIGGYTCTCREGYTGNGRFCRELLCPTLPHLFHGTISRSNDINTDGTTVTYQCDSGYVLRGARVLTCNLGIWSAGRAVCEDVNECEERPSPCDENANCTNLAGSYRCTCNSGYRGDGSSCSRITCEDPPIRNGAEVLSGGSGPFLPNHQVAYVCSSGFISTGGGASISCSPGGIWLGQFIVCSDINECSEPVNPCTFGANCVNTIGSYTCSCNSGYTGDGSTCERLSCDDLDLPENSMMSSLTNPPFSSGDVVTFSCQSGYEMQGGAVLVCDRETLQWSALPPVCNDVDECLSPFRCHSNAACHNLPGRHQCVCEEGYSGDGRFCRPNSCDPVSPPRGGSFVAPTGFIVGGEAIFDCQDGFQLDGSRVITCMTNSQWSDVEPTCEDVDECALGLCTGTSAVCRNFLGSYSCTCPHGYTGNPLESCTPLACTDPPTIHRATASPPSNGVGYVFGEVVTYTCAAGYQVRGGGSVTCSTGNRWTSNFGTVCSDINECAGETRVCHVRALCSNTIGSYRCSCRSGYFGDGVTSCEARTCDLPSEIDNGRIAPSNLLVWQAGVTLSVVCFSGYQVSGSSSQITCRSDGSLSASIPTCIDIDECEDPFNTPCDRNAACTNMPGSFTCACNEGYSGSGSICHELICPLPNRPQNGQIVPANQLFFSDGSTVTYICRGGYRILSSSFTEARCQSNGAWVPPNPPLCTDVDECAERNNLCHEEATCTNTLGGYTCVCNEGYEGNGQNCQVVRCDTPSVPNNGRYSTNGISQFVHGTVINFFCNPGYITDTPTATCVDGWWQPRVVTCSDTNECYGDTSPCHESATCQNNVGSFSCRCNEGYQGDGRNDCQRMTCPTRVAPSNGVLNTNGRVVFQYGDAISYRCNVGFTLIGHVDAMCRANGQWSSNPPHCTDINECLRRNPCHSDADCDNTHGSYTCRCRHGYFGDGSTTCTLITCNEPSTPMHGSFGRLAEYSLNTVVTFNCIDGYQVSGTRQLTCTASGQWSHNEPTCVDIDECSLRTSPCHALATCTNTEGSYHCECNVGLIGDGTFCSAAACSNLENPQQGSISYTNEFAVGSIATYSCYPGWQLDRNVQLVCQSNRQWSNIPPRCVDIDECASPQPPCHDQSTCSNTPGSYMCTCNRGHVLRGNACILVTCQEPPVPDRGFITNASRPQWVYGDVITYSCHPGFEFVGQREVTCQQTGAWSSGPPSCNLRIPDLRWCTASGDPHYETFDRHHYDFQGNCLYDFIKTTERGIASGLVPVTVETENENRFGLTHVSWLRRAIIRLPDVTIELRKELRVLINGVLTVLPYSDESGLVVRRAGRYININTAFGMQVRYDGNHYFTVGLPPTYFGNVEGLCGNYNGDADDDFLLRGGVQVASNNVQFGNSFQINSPTECAAATASDNPCTDANLRRQYENQCNIILDVTGCFASCHAAFEPLSAYEDCVFDLCAFRGERQALSDSVASYAAVCQRNNMPMCDWRSQINAPLECPGNSTYSRCTSACPNSCADRDSERLCPDYCVEGCECNEGFIWSGDECVTAGQCGCASEGSYYKNGDSFFMVGCTQHCTCLDGELHCFDTGCSPDQRCVPDENGVLGCRLPYSSCNQRPIRQMVRPPSSCANPDRSGRYEVDVGGCPSVRCPTTGLFVTSCCGEVASVMVDVPCADGSVIHVSRVTACGCTTCIAPTITVSGMVFNDDTGSIIPLQNGLVSRNNRTATRTDIEGKFSLTVDADVDRLVLTFVDPSGQLMTTTKVLLFKRLGGSIFHNIRLNRKAPTFRFPSSQRGSFSPASTSGRPNVITIEVEPNSYFDKAGHTYTALVEASLSYIDPRNLNSYVVAPSDMISEGGEIIQTYGIFQMDFRDGRNRELDIRNIRVSISADQVSILSQRSDVRLWSLDTTSGLWRDEGEMTLTSGSHGSLIFSANLPSVINRRTICIGVPAQRSCYIKVRAYRSDEFNPWDQVSYVQVDAVYRQTQNFNWRSFAAGLTEPDTGACMRVFCDFTRSGDYEGIFTAALNADENLLAAPSDGQDPDVIGVAAEALSLVNYRRGDLAAHVPSNFPFSIGLPAPTNTTHLAGPFYRERFDCIAAPISDSHFRFSRQPTGRLEFNTIPIDENNIYFTWKNHPLIWWPRPNQFRACYLKVKLVGNNPSGIVVRARSSVGMRQGHVNQLYGVREDVSVGNHFEAAVCLEFRCSTLTRDGADERSLVDIIPSRASCVRGEENELLTNYLATREPFAVQDNPTQFRMYAPQDPLGHTYGAYTVTQSDPVIAKQLALGHCMAGESTIVSNEMRVDNNVAITFNC